MSRFLSTLFSCSPTSQRFILLSRNTRDAALFPQYCSTEWLNTSKGTIQKLQLVQNFAARIVLGLKNYDKILQGLKSLNWFSVSKKLYFQDAIMVFKCINNLVPDYCKDEFVTRSQTHSRTTRNVINGQLDIPKCRLITGQRSYYYRECKYIEYFA